MNLIRLSWVLVNPSIREGWGINIIEGYSKGTPAIAYNVPGLRDSIINNNTGLLVEPTNSTTELAKSIIKIINDSNLRKRLSKNALRLSHKFNWEIGATQVSGILTSVMIAQR